MSPSSPRSKFTILWAFLIGAAAIVVVRLLMTDAAGHLWSALIAAGFAVLVMWLHGYYRRDEADQERLADDTYYLGLLFTLVSLIYALVVLFLLDQDGDLTSRTNNLVGSFGIGLLSTLAGILGRIWLQGKSSEWAPPPATGPDATSHDLDEPVMELRRQVREAANAMSHFTRITLSEANQTRTHMKRVVDRYHRDLQQSAEQALKKSTEYWEEVNENVASLCDALEATRSAFSAMSATLQSGAENTAEALQTAASETINQLRSEAESSSRETGRLMHSHVERFSESWHAAIAPLDPLKDALLDSTRAYSEFAQSIRSRTESEKAHAERLTNDLRSNLASSVHEFKADAAQAWREASNQVSIPAQALVSAAESAHGSLKQGEASMQGLIEQMKVANDALALLSEGVVSAHAHLSQLNAATEHTSKQLNEAQEALDSSRKDGEMIASVGHFSESVQELTKTLLELTELAHADTRGKSEKPPRARFLSRFGR